MQVIWSLIGLFIGALAVSFQGGVHPVGDSLAVFRVGLCLALLLLAATVRNGAFARLGIISLSVIGIASAMWHKIPKSDPGPVTIYQKNVLHRNSELSSLAADILATGPDFVTLQEVSVEGEALLRDLKAAYPYQVLCRYSPKSGVAVLSRIEPLDKGDCRQSYGKAMITVDLPTGRHHVAAIHMAWPFPGGQPAQFEQFFDDLRALEHPILIGGDFNMVPWSHALRQVARVSGTKHSTPARTTFLIGSVPIAIDHVFAPGGGYVETRPLFGADHFGILARVHAALQTSVRSNAN
ncbi:MAG: endonuclease/exonuclease/phosphatase family protein [Pseudomonadota bacterium]